MRVVNLMKILHKNNFLRAEDLVNETRVSNESILSSFHFWLTCADCPSLPSPIDIYVNQQFIK